MLILTKQSPEHSESKLRILYNSECTLTAAVIMSMVYENTSLVLVLTNRSTRGTTINHGKMHKYSHICLPLPPGVLGRLGGIDAEEVKQTELQLSGSNAMSSVASTQAA